MPFEVLCACDRRLAVTAGDAGTTLRCGCGRMVPIPALHELRLSAGVFAPATEPRRPPPASSAQLTGVDLAICLLLPVVGFIAGILRLLRGEPTAGRMLSVSGTVLLIVLFLTGVFRGVA